MKNFLMASTLLSLFNTSNAFAAETSAVLCAESKFDAAEAVALLNGKLQKSSVTVSVMEEDEQRGTITLGAPYKVSAPTVLYIPGTLPSQDIYMACATVTAKKL